MTCLWCIVVLTEVYWLTINVNCVVMEGHIEGVGNFGGINFIWYVGGFEWKLGKAMFLRD